MSTKRRNRSRWDSPRSPLTSAPAPAAASAAAAGASAPAATTAPAAAAGASPAPARSRSPNVSTAAPPLSDFALDYRYELSLPAQIMLSRLERQPWLEPLSEYSNNYSSSHDPTGYGLQGRHYGSFTGDAPPQLEDYPSVLHNSKVLQHYPGDFQNDKTQLSSQLLPGLASEAPMYLDPERDRWHAVGLARQNPSLYGLSSGHGDYGQPLQLARNSEYSSERALSGGPIDAKLSDGQIGSASLIGGRDDAMKGRDPLEKLPIGLQDPKLYCSVCDRAFPTAHQKEAHLQSHVKCEEEHCQFEATARKVKEHMLSEHGKQLKNALRASGGSQKELEGAQASENQRNNLENSDGKRNNELPEPRERQRVGMSTPTGVRPQDTRNDPELVARKSRENRNYRVPGRYFPY